MKAILMAAGRGTRISRHIDGKPKCTVLLGDGTTLIEHSVDQLVSKGVDRIVLVLGYRGEIIRQTLGDRPVTYRQNPFYDVTNSIASLWFAQDELEGDDHYILMNGDVFLSSEAIDLILAEKRSPALFYDVTRRAEADYKFFCDGERLLGRDDWRVHRLRLFRRTLRRRVPKPPTRARRGPAAHAVVGECPVLDGRRTPDHR